MKCRLIASLIGESDTSAVSATRCWWNDKSIASTLVNFNQNFCFIVPQEMSAQGEDVPQTVDFSEIVFVGTGAASTFAKLDARAFVKKFKRQFEHARGRASAAKREVRHIYFLDRHSSVPAVRRVSFAQAVVNKLHAAGFKNVIVHRIEKPAKCKRDHFETTLSETGKVNSHIQLISETSEHQPQLRFALESDPKYVLNKPQHTFLRGENKFSKRARVAREIIKHQCKTQIEATNEFRRLLLSFKNEMNPAVTKQIRKQLKTILHQLELADKYEWRATLREANSYLSNHRNNGRHFLGPGSQIRNQVDDLIWKYTKHAVSACDLRDKPRPMSTPTFDDVYAEFQERIEALIFVLTTDQDELRSSKRPWFFYHYEMNTKEAKINALRELQNQANFDGLISAACRLQKNRRVMRSFKRHNTSDLINDIITFAPASCIDSALLDESSRPPQNLIR